MTGAQLRARREAFGIAPDRFAAALDLPVETLGEIEGAGHIPRRMRQRALQVLWEFASAAALDASGLPECLHVGALLAADPPDVRAVGAHLKQCPVCRSRTAYVHAHVGHAPRPPGISGFITGLVDAFADGPPWLRAAAGGVAMVLTVVAVPIVICLASAVIFRDRDYLGWSIIFSEIALLGGGAGGLVYAAAGPLRARGRVGYYLSWIAAVYAYTAVTVAAVYVGSFLLHLIPPQRDVAAMVHEPADQLFLLVFGAIFGLLIGRSVEEGTTTDPDRTTMGPFGSRRRLLAVFAVVATLAGIGIQTIRFSAPEHPDPARTTERGTDAAAEMRTAVALQAQRREAEALRHARTAVALAPRHAAYWATLGTIAYAANRPDEARRAYRNALAIDPDVLSHHPELQGPWRELNGPP
ncbi:MAG TPA: tetratricopeptide repeat protein [Gemmatimonadales bacterium]|nr:tetratricopeptide repeat protein [Gemmatimonadales bacterium]